MVSDPDGDSVSLGVTAGNPQVVRAYVDHATGDVVLEPLAPGSSDIVVTAHDGESTTAQSFEFEVGEVTKVVQVSTGLDGAAISLVNTGDQAVDFVLTHNGFRTFQTVDEIVDHVHEMPPEFAGEAFPRKLWRFVRDNVYHWPFLGPNLWLMNSLVQVNSIGWGFCSSVAVLYVEVAQAAGYEARVWALGGHVVAEIHADGEWAVFDPDLAVYYNSPTGRIVGIAELQADPSLVSSPIDPLFAASEYGAPYATAIAGIYGIQSDNFIWSSLLPTPMGQSGRVVLPPGARLTYQGKWTAAPVGRDDEGQPYPVPEYRQAALSLASAWTGTITLPWVPWDVTGSGEVDIGGTRFVIDSEALRQRLRNSSDPIRELNIVESGGETQVVFLINPMRYEVLTQNVVELTGRNVWQVLVQIEDLPLQFHPGPPFATERRKPVPLNGQM